MKEFIVSAVDLAVMLLVNEAVLRIVEDEKITPAVLNKLKFLQPRLDRVFTDIEDIERKPSHHHSTKSVT